jgi:hypothetical protein
VVVAVRLPEVPVIVTVAVAEGAELFACSVSTLEPVAGFVLHDAVTPLGNPEAAKFTLLLNPYWGITVMEDVAELLWFKLR